MLRLHPAALLWSAWLACAPAAGCGSTQSGLERVATISHPATTDEVGQSAVLGSDDAVYRFASNSPAAICFRIEHADTKESPAEVARHKYELLLLLANSEAEIRRARRLVGEPVRVLDSDSKTHQGLKKQTHTSRDSHGNLVGSVSRLVPYSYEKYHVTSEVCFGKHREALTPAIRFLTLRRTDARLPGTSRRHIQAVWRLVDGGEKGPKPTREE